MFSKSFFILFFCFVLFKIFQVYFVCFVPQNIISLGRCFIFSWNGWLIYYGGWSVLWILIRSNWLITFKSSNFLLIFDLMFCRLQRKILTLSTIILAIAVFLQFYQILLTVFWRLFCTCNLSVLYILGEMSPLSLYFFFLFPGNTPILKSNFMILKLPFQLSF